MAYIDTGERIREIRRQRGLSQDQLAELASLNRVTVAKYESGKVEPGAQSLGRIADALEVSADTLLGRSEQKLELQEDVMLLRQQLRENEARELFGAIRKASPEHLRAVTAMLKALEPSERDE